MSVTTDRVLNSDQLNDTDGQLLDVLAAGRVTPTFAAEEAGVSREYASDRLKRLTEHGNVEKVAPGLYELRYDPRDDAADAPDEAYRLRAAVDDLQAERDALERDLAAARERIEHLEEQDRQAAVDADRARQALDELEAALERGDRDRAEDALEQARGALRG